MDLRAWLKLYESASNRPITAWANAAGQVVVVNRQYDNRGLLSKETVPHLLTLDTPGWFDSTDWGSSANPATTYTYEALKRPSRRTNPDATFMEWSYSGWDTHEIDENRHKRIFANDAFARLTTVQELTGTDPWTVDDTWVRCDHWRDLPEADDQQPIRTRARGVVARGRGATHWKEDPGCPTRRERAHPGLADGSGATYRCCRRKRG
ncbi:MAG: hypothetical protein HYY05_02155 [Chloroflexi bacterium]|nr:hypothetical protein [Chloroflexota bacterium]